MNIHTDCPACGARDLSEDGRDGALCDSCQGEATGDNTTTALPEEFSTIQERDAFIWKLADTTGPHFPALPLKEIWDIPILPCYVRSDDNYYRGQEVHCNRPAGHRVELGHRLIVEWTA